MGLLEQELQSQAGELPGGDNSTARFIPIEALELQGDEPKGLDFHHASVRVNATETAEGTEYSAVFEHEPLQGRAFFKFLYHIAPAPEGDNVSAVYYDWRLPDKPNYKFAGRDNPELIRLHAAHLGRHWVDFEGSRSDFMVALLSGAEKWGRNRNWSKYTVAAIGSSDDNYQKQTENECLLPFSHMSILYQNKTIVRCCTVMYNGYINLH